MARVCNVTLRFLLWITLTHVINTLMFRYEYNRKLRFRAVLIEQLIILLRYIIMVILHSTMVRYYITLRSCVTEIH